MCGIVGAIGFIDHKLIKLVEEMNNIQVHRGPNGHGFWKSNAVDDTFLGSAFAHRRLAIIDLSSGAHQPMSDSNTGNTLVFNGEIYNYLELKEELEKLSVVFRSCSDTEVILHAYRIWGENFATRLRGMFTIVIWDAKKRQTIMYRDRLGIKPLYYSTIKKYEKQTLIFSSEIKTLLKSGVVEKKLNPASVESFIWNGFVAGGESTILQNVFQVQAGYKVIIDDHGNIQSKNLFWDFPSYDSTQKPISIAEVKDELEKSVKLHLASDVPLGVFLSGGIDSSAVASLAVQQGHSEISTYNLAFEEMEFSEAKYARTVASELGTEHHEIILTQSEFINSLDDAMSSMDQPSFDGINTYFISREIRKAGITVALAGTGGDELFGGYKSFVDVPRVTKYSQLFSHFPNAIVQALSDSATSGLERLYGNVPPQTRWGKIADIIQVKGDLFKAFQTSYALFTKDFFNQLIITNERYTEYGLDSHLANDLRENINNEPELKQVSTMELYLFIKERLMRDTDSASMAVSLEVRVPLLDHVLLEKVSRLDMAQRFEPLGKKQLLRELAIPNLDAKMFDRPKSGFVLPFDRWCRDALQKDVEETLNDRTLCFSVGLNPDAVTALYQAFIAGVRGIYWSRVWAIYSFLWWCRKYNVSI
tara:strand:- start:92761 stop:94701 length:1941 start_codon:yes stop_codon:yes gene_type:complete